MRDRRNETKTTFELHGWGESNGRDPRKKGRRGGMWSRWSFDTLKEARAEQKKQLKDQAFKVKQRAIDAKKFGEARAEFTWGSDFEHEFPIFKREWVPNDE